MDHVLVNVAHTIDNDPIENKKIGVDFYVSKLYKWFFTPPSITLIFARSINLATTGS
jgi:selenocysteine lyase/cysteine desulfurase